jgi:uncharacterized membrane protein YtjA (UPF0391 family)
VAGQNRAPIPAAGAELARSVALERMSVHATMGGRIICPVVLQNLIRIDTRRFLQQSRLAHMLQILVTSPEQRRSWGYVVRTCNRVPVQTCTANKEERTMFNWALIFLIIGLIAAVFGFTGIAGTATNIAWILFVVGLVLAVVFFIMGRRPRV